MAFSVPCRFFARGYCRNGNSCRFLHDSQENQQQNSPNSNFRFMRSNVLSENRSQNKFSNAYQQPQDRELKQNVVQDVIAWEEGDQWLFTCFAPIKDGENFPEFNDISPEELRWNAYQAEKQGTSHNYNQEICNLASEVKRKRAALKNPSPNIMETLIKIRNNSLEKEEPNNFNQNSNLFGSSTAAPSFSFKLPTNTIKPPTLFGNQENLASSTTSSFTSGNSMFGNAGISTPVIQPTFGQTQPMQTNNAFNQLQNPVFSNQQSNVSNFPFASSTTQNDPTNLATKTTNPKQSFGFQTNQSFNTFGKSEASTIYSNISDLSEAEKQEFMNPSFTLGLIPEKAPPREFV